MRRHGGIGDMIPISHCLQGVGSKIDYRGRKGIEAVEYSPLMVSALSEVRLSFEGIGLCLVTYHFPRGTSGKKKLLLVGAYSKTHQCGDTYGVKHKGILVLMRQHDHQSLILSLKSPFLFS